MSHYLKIAEYAILVSTEVPTKQEITYDSLQQSVHFDAHEGVKKIQADRKVKVWLLHFNFLKTILTAI